MKKTYIIPEMLTVELNVKTSVLTVVSNESTENYSNKREANSEWDAETKANKNVWDEEW